MPKVTLRDIAARCGVTPTVVSAVLNGRGQRSRCSAEKQNLIRRTALEMNYHPNILARSMVTRAVPVVALMLHLDPHAIAYESRYFAESAAGASSVLAENDLETLLVLYRSQEEQIARFTALARKGVIGGVVSNIAYRKNADFIRTLQSSGLPYCLEGEPEIPAIAVMPESRFVENNLFMQALKRYGGEKLFLHQSEGGQDVLYPYHNIPGYSRFRYEPIPPAPEITADPKNVIVSLGYEYYLQLSCRMKIACPLVTERREFEFLIPAGVPRIICEGNHDLIGDAVDLLLQWQLHGRKPECRIHYFSRNDKFVLKW